MATIKQKRAVAKIVENGGNVSKGMRDAGYSPATAENPKKLTESLAWQDLLEQAIPDSLLTKVHMEGLAALKQETRLTGKGESELVEVPDFNVRHKYLETGYKVKAKYAEGNSTQVLVVNITGNSSTRYGGVTDGAK